MRDDSPDWNVTTPSVLRIGMVGVGSMGMPIARRISAAGYPLTVVARRPQIAEQARSLGASVETLAGLGASCDVVILNVFGDDQVREVALGRDGVVAHMRPGTTLVNHTTGRPSSIREIACAAHERDVATLDCPMSGGPADIAAGELTLLVGGDSAALDTVKSVLATYSSPILHVGDVGDAQKVKLLNNALFGAQVAMVARVEQCATELAMDPARVLAAIRDCSGDSHALRAAVGSGSAQRLVEAARLYIRQDVSVCAEVAMELGSDLGSVLTVAREI